MPTPKDFLREKQLDGLVSKNQDFHGRRVVNAGASVDPKDYVIQDELTKAIVEINKQIAIINTLSGVGGAVNLINTNVIPKIESRGKLTESSLSDDGIAVKTNLPIESDIGVSPYETNFRARANGLGFLGFRCFAPDNMSIDFDCEWTNNEFIARDTSAALLAKITDKIRFYYMNSLTIDDPITVFNVGIELDCLTGDVSLSNYTANGLVRTSGGTGLLGVGDLIPSDLSGYAFVSLTGQTATIGATNIQPDGAIAIANKLYFLVGYLHMTTVATAGTISVNITWNDGAAVRTQTASVIATGLNYAIFNTQIIPNGSTNIQYSVTFTGITGSPVYSLRMAIIKLFD